MSCCGDDGDDGGGGLPSQVFLPNSDSPDTNPVAIGEARTTASAAASSTAVGIFSPMDSNFSALLSRDLLRAILELLPSPTDLARSACVCRLWRAVASEREMRERAFRAPWNVAQVLGEPSSSAFWRYPSLDRFAISHRLRRSDTVVGLALMYSVQVMDIKRLNNMMSDHGIHSRERLLIPIRKPELLIRSNCYIELDKHAKREVAVLYLEGCPDGKANYLTNRANNKKKILESVKRSMQVDDGTAEYYLSMSNGDPRTAILQFSEDLRWEQQITSRC